MRDDLYGYDASGNVAYILDYLPGNVISRSMTYDGLDRLRTANAPNLWDRGTFAYDALDNLIATSISAGPSARDTHHNARDTHHNINATTKRLDKLTNTPPTS